MSKKLNLLTSVVMVLVLAGGAMAIETLVVPQGTTHTVTGKEVYSSFEVAGTLIVEKGGELTAGLGTDKPRSTIDGLEAKVIVNGGVINVNSRINVGYASNATIIMNGGLFRIGDVNRFDDTGDIKMPDNEGGTQRIILNGGLLWAHRCQTKYAFTDDAKIIVAGGEMRLDTLGEGEETIVALLEALENGDSLEGVSGIAYRSGGDIKINGRRSRVTDLDAIATPAWHHFELETYHQNRFVGGMYSSSITVPMLATRGCPYQCTYCSAPNMWTPRWIPRDGR